MREIEVEIGVERSVRVARERDHVFEVVLYIDLRIWKNNRLAK